MGAVQVVIGEPRLIPGSRVICDGTSKGIVAAVLAKGDSPTDTKILLAGSELVSMSLSDFSSVVATGEFESIEKDGLNVGQCVRLRLDESKEWKNGVITHVEPYVKVVNADDSDDEFDASGYEYDDIVDDDTLEKPTVLKAMIWEM